MPRSTGQKELPGAAGTQVGCPALFTVGVGCGALSGGMGGSDPTHKPPPPWVGSESPALSGGTGRLLDGSSEGSAWCGVCFV